LGQAIYGDPPFAAVRTTVLGKRKALALKWRCPNQVKLPIVRIFR